MRLIDADNIHYTRLLSHQGLDMELVAKTVIDNMPTIDAEPVRHGRWEPEFRHDIFGKPFICRHVCSACGNGALCECANYDAEEELSPYCPNCGAKMDAEVQDGTK